MTPHGTRLLILRAILERPRTAHALQRITGLPHTASVLTHLRGLRKAGLVAYAPGNPAVYFAGPHDHHS